MLRSNKATQNVSATIVLFYERLESWMVIFQMPQYCY